MHDIAQIMAERIASGLARRSLTTCSRWALGCRVMGKPYVGKWTFKYHPWLKGMHDSQAEMNVGQKSAQMGYTEWALNTAFFNIDIKAVNTLYVLPAQTPDATDFSAARFDPALELSNHLSKLFSDVKNVGHKRAGSANLYIRGSRSRSGLKSIPVGLIILDEVDEMDQDNIPLALERAAGQVEKMVLALSTPTIPNYGINKLYRDTTQEHFFFKCPACTRRTELVFPDCLKITADDVNDPKVEDSYLFCKECKATLLQKDKCIFLQTGEWVPAYTDRLPRGFHVNQLYSSTVSAPELAKSFLRSQRDPSEEQEFHNSKLGQAHIVEGAGVTDADLDRATGTYKKLQVPPRVGCLTMGVDVGRWLHYEICQWTIPGDIKSVDLNVQSKARMLTHGKKQHFEELDDLMRFWGINFCVIDANPERRKAHEFSSRFFGLVKMCFYGQGIQGKQIHVAVNNAPEPTITVDRTSWLDLSLGRFRGVPTITIPVDTDQEYRRHMKALVRVYEKDKLGNQTGRYIKGNDEDHYAHARNYCEIALPFAVSATTHQNIYGER